MVDEEVLRRVAVAGPGLPANSAQAPAAIAARAGTAIQPADPFARPTTAWPTTISSTPVKPPAVGGVGRLESDPPREGTGWRAVR
jgi:hypothetical protein